MELDLKLFVEMAIGLNEEKLTPIELASICEELHDLHPHQTEEKKDNESLVTRLQLHHNHCPAKARC
jgi:hypothetical protein